jgi:hypothetical protein
MPELEINYLLLLLSLESHLKGHQPIYVFNFLFLIWKRVQSSEPLHAKRPLILLLVRISVCMCSNHDLFRRTVLQKCGRHQLFFGLRLVSKEFQYSAIQTKIEVHFGGFFHQIKVRQPIARQDFMQTVIRTKRRLESFLHEAAQNFEVFSNIQDQK